MSKVLTDTPEVSVESVIADFFSSEAPSFNSKEELYEVLGDRLCGMSLGQFEVLLMNYINSSSDIVDVRDVSDLEANASNTYTTDTKYQVIS